MKWDQILEIALKKTKFSNINAHIQQIVEICNAHSVIIVEWFLFYSCFLLYYALWVKYISRNCSRFVLARSSVFSKSRIWAYVICSTNVHAVLYNISQKLYRKAYEVLLAYILRVAEEKQMCLSRRLYPALASHDTRRKYLEINSQLLLIDIILL